ncbi:NADP-dependent oxidoreductase [Ferrimonas lipolytica]|uniref:NADP-dependent oxidoreductase n=1 Tax=Ferrimonas lipolytica TaxID=2724191 RepID=A0A6H1U8T7_9GAMM|nr:NADP-dependent oxidoreductase [Ferrimonas lipolytica]QIZ75455.1 NADP-dependent oxidoreductase [Ferrimonas lipolytica]
MSHSFKGWQFQHYPVGMPDSSTVTLVEEQLGDLSTGQVLIKNLWLSVDPYMRGRMINTKSYVPPFQPGELLQGGAIGKVIESNNPQFPVGAEVMHMQGWRELAISDGSDLTAVGGHGLPLQNYLSVMGLTGLTAWAGLNKVGQLRADDVVFVSGAAGAVGSIVCQLAKLAGAKVIGSAGSDSKVAWLSQQLGVDAAFNYKHSDDLTATLKSLAPEGISLFFDNVGGAHLQAAMANMQDFGRIVSCGMIDQYNAEAPVAGPTNMADFIRRRIRMQGFIASDFMADYQQFAADVGGYLMAGKLVNQETVVEGIESTYDGFLGLFSGANTGKMLVKL